MGRCCGRLGVSGFLRGGAEAGEVRGFGFRLGCRLAFGFDFGSDFGFDLFVAFAEGFEEAASEGVFVGCVGVGQFEERGYGAVGGVGDDLLDDLFGGRAGAGTDLGRLTEAIWRP